MSASTPKLSQIEEINSLLAELDALHENVQFLKNKLKQSEIEYAKEIDRQTSYMISQITEQLSSEASQKAMQLTYHQEADLREKLLAEIIEPAIESYFQSGEHQKLVLLIIKNLEAKKVDFTILAGLDSLSYLPEKTKYKAAEKGRLSIQAQVQSYLLDPSLLRKELRTRLLQELSDSLFVVSNPNNLENQTNLKQPS